MFTLLFIFIFYSFIHSPFSVSLSSLPLHLFFLPPQTHRPFFLPQRPIVDLHKPSRHKPVATDPRSAADLPISASLLYFWRFGFMFRAVLVFRVVLVFRLLCFELACVSNLCFGLGFCIRHGFRFLFLAEFVFRAVIFLLSFFFFFTGFDRHSGVVVVQ